MKPNESTVIRDSVTAGTTRRLPGPANLTTTAEPSSERRLEQLRAEFAHELAQLHEASRQEGLASGRLEAARELDEARTQLQAEYTARVEQAQASLEQKLADHVEQLDKLLQALEDQSQRLIPSMEPVVGRLALAVVGRVLGREQASGMLIPAMARQAIEAYSLTGPLRIYISPEDYRLVKKHGAADEFTKCLQVDTALGSGACRIDFGTGLLDAGMETQLAASQALLLHDEENTGVAAV